MPPSAPAQRVPLGGRPPVAPAAARPMVAEGPSSPIPIRRPPHGLSPAVRTTLLAVCGIRSGAVVLDLTADGSLVRPAGAAAGRGGVVLVAAPAALSESVPALLRGAAVSNAFAALPGTRLLGLLRPLLRPGARVAVTAVDADAIAEAAALAGYQVLHVESGVDGVVVAGLRPQTSS